MNQFNVRQLLADHRLAPSKQMGQNFLIHAHIAEQIVAAAEVGDRDTVVELGVGLGALTIPLAARAKEVIGLELDKGIVEYHRSTGELPANVKLLHQDLLTADYNAMARGQGQKLKIIANLPYAVTNLLLFRLLEQHQAMEWAVLMIQKEVAQRLVGRPGSKEYGVLTVLLGACATMERLLTVGPGNFYPKPKVDSVVIRINFHAPPDAKGMTNLALLRRVVDTAFGQRRKTLLNSLSSGRLPTLGRLEAAQALAKAGISEQLRAENLTTADYIRLTEVIAQLEQP